MDRKDITLIKVLQQLRRKVSFLLQSYFIPTVQELLFIASRGVSYLIDTFSEKDYSYQASFIGADELLSKNSNGYCLDGRRKLTSKNSQMHALVVGASGSGKTQCVVLPSLLELKGSLIISDPSGELYTLSAGYLQTKGYEIITINYSNPQVSHGYNPMERIETVSDCNKIAHMLVRSTLKGAGDPFWQLQSETLLTLLMRALLLEGKAYRHLAGVRHLIQLLSADHKVVDALIARTADSQLINEYKSFLSFDAKVRLGIQATCLAALQIFSDPAVAKVTSVDTLNLEKIRTQKTAIFIHCNTADMSFYSSVTSVFFEQLSKVIMAKLPQETDLPIYYILDEFSSLYMPNIQVTISNIRKYKAGMMLICQDYQQIVDVYGRQQADSIRSNCFSKLYFGGVSHATATELSAQLGKFNYESEKGTKLRELKTADEIRTLPKEKAILICGNYKPILLHMTPIYKHPFFKLRTQIPPPRQVGALPPNGIALLNG